MLNEDNNEMCCLMKIISEQLSHHPPIMALHCEGRGWSCWVELDVASKFRGQYLTLTPLGKIHVHFNDTGSLPYLVVQVC